MTKTKTEPKTSVLAQYLLVLVIAALAAIAGAEISDDSVEVATLNTELSAAHDSVNALKEQLSVVSKQAENRFAALQRKDELLNSVRAELSAERAKEPEVVTETVEVIKEVPTVVPDEDSLKKLERIDWYLDQTGSDTETLDEFLEDISFTEKAHMVISEDIEDADGFDDHGFRNSEISVRDITDTSVTVNDRHDMEYTVCATAEVLFDDDEDVFTEEVDVCVEFFENDDHDLDWDMDVV